nr:hypothetical protein [Demequina litorisediminis]
MGLFDGLSGEALDVGEFCGDPLGVGVLELGGDRGLEFDDVEGVSLDVVKVGGESHAFLHDREFSGGGAHLVEAR